MTETLYRELTLDRKGMDTEARVVPASLSSEIEVPRWFGREVLVHDAASVDLTRARDGLPLLFSHDHTQPIGLAENVRIEDGRLRANLRFSNNTRASEVWADVRDGFLKNISIGYQVRKYDEGEDDTVRVTDWALLEASVVTVPADASIGINRGQDDMENPNMDDKTETRASGKTAGQGSGDVNVIDYQAARDSAKAEGLVEGQRAERKRIDEIEGLFTGTRFTSTIYQDLKAELVRSGTGIDAARAQLLALVGQDSEPAAAGEFRQDRGTVAAGHDEQDKFAAGMAEALEVRVGLITDRDAIRDARKSELFSMNMTELAREYCRRNQINTSGMNREKVIGQAMTRAVIGHGSDDFANLLENIASKSLLVGWDEAPESWQAWCRQGNLPDFKQASRTGLSSFEDLEVVYENGEYKYGSFADLKETIQLVTYGKMFNISRQALANDDLDSLGTVPRKMGRAASRTVGDQAYNIFFQAAGLGPTLNQDSTALFDAAGHSNYLASGSGAAPSVATLNTAMTAMALQSDPSGNATSLGIRPRYLIVPEALRATAQTLMAATYDPTGTAGTLTPNTVNGTMTVVTDARIDANLATSWYLAADQNMHDTVEVAFLNGQSTPYLEQREGWTVDGTEFKVRIDCGVAALDFRGLYKNYGA